MRLRVTLIVTLLLLAGARAHAEVVTFEDLPTLVKSNNRQVKAAGVNVKAYEYRTPYLSQSFLPNFTASTGRQLLAKTDGNNFGAGQAFRLETYVNIYNGGRDQIEEQVRQSLRDVAAAELLKESAQQLLSARRLFWQIIGLQALMDLNERAIAATQGYIKSAKTRIDHGIATQADLIQFELQSDTLVQDQKRLLLELDIAKSQLAVIIGSPDHVSLEVRGQLLHPTHDRLTPPTQKIKDNPDLSVLRSRIDMLNYQESQLRTSWQPQVDLFSDFGQPTYIDRDARVGSDRREWFLGMRLRINLADSLTDQRESKARLSQALATQLRLEDNQARLDAFVHELQSEIPLRHELLHDAARNEKRAETLLKLIADEYNRGIRNAAELLSSAEQRLNASRRLIEQTRDFYLTESQLALLSGT